MLLNASFGSLVQHIGFVSGKSENTERFVGKTIDFDVEFFQYAKQRIDIHSEWSKTGLKNADPGKALDYFIFGFNLLSQYKLHKLKSNFTIKLLIFGFGEKKIIFNTKM